MKCILQKTVLKKLLMIKSYGCVRERRRRKKKEEEEDPEWNSFCSGETFSRGHNSSRLYPFDLVKVSFESPRWDLQDGTITVTWICKFDCFWKGGGCKRPPPPMLGLWWGLTTMWVFGKKKDTRANLDPLNSVQNNLAKVSGKLSLL